jgi:magnesium transporter
MKNAGNSRHAKRYYRMQRRTLPGAAPGTIEVDPDAGGTRIDVLAYDDSRYEERTHATFEQLARCLSEWPATWVNVTGLGDPATIDRLGEIFSLHPLVLEDVVNVHQRPKVEDYDDELFVVSRMVYLDPNGEDIRTEQLSLLVRQGCVVTFQERPGDVLEPVRERIRNGKRIRAMGIDYLAYAIIDAVVDHYFPVLETYGERLEALEDAVMAGTDPEPLRRIHDAKHQLLTLRRAIWPQRDALGALHREPFDLITDNTRIYLRDTYDHAIQVIDFVETYRELASSLLDVHLTSLSNRMNDIMKTLTIFAAIFIPLNFIAAVYGMNFDPGRSPWNMPELRWRWGYPFALALMAATGIAILAFMHRRGWLRRLSR